MKLYLTRRATFNAAHRLWVDEWTEEKNYGMFGKCANKYYHGHNYELFVTVKGKPNPVTGFVMDAKRLYDLMKIHITEVLDHTNLTMNENFLPKGTQPTTENLAYYIWQQLKPHITECELHSVKLYETENIYAEYYGE